LEIININSIITLLKKRVMFGVWTMKIATRYLERRRAWYDRSTKTDLEREFRLSFFYHGVRLVFSRFE